jgi:protein involved in polysaccharide export with SLBB domain
MLQGDYTLRFQGEKLSDVIERAGGLRAGAYLPGARLFRQEREGRAQIPVDFERALADRNSLENVDIVEGDSIYVPPLDNVVYVKGEVYTPAGVVYRRGASLSYYIQQAGGFTKAAESEDVAVTLPNGRKWEPGWFIFPDPEILPGSTVMVPQKLETEDNTLPILRDMTTIMASLAAITVALIQVTK